MCTGDDHFLKQVKDSVNFCWNNVKKNNELSYPILLRGKSLCYESVQQIAISWQSN